MPQIGHRFPLIIYEHMINRWWPATLTLGLIMTGLWWPTSRHPIGQQENWRGYGLLAIGGAVMLFSLFLVLIRKAAYVQPFSNYLRLVTPFIRLNISYLRFKGTSTVAMKNLFPGKNLSPWKRTIIKPLMSKIAVVIDLNDYPLPPSILRFFLSPFFFKDKTPHLVLLVTEWMRFIAETESLYVAGVLPHQNPGGDTVISEPT